MNGTFVSIMRGNEVVADRRPLALARLIAVRTRHARRHRILPNADGWPRPPAGGADTI